MHIWLKTGAVDAAGSTKPHNNNYTGTYMCVGTDMYPVPTNSHTDWNLMDKVAMSANDSNLSSSYSFLLYCHCPTQHSTEPVELLRNNFTTLEKYFPGPTSI